MTDTAHTALDRLHRLIADAAQREFEDSLTAAGTVAHPDHLGSRIAAEVIQSLTAAGLLLPTGTRTVEQYNTRLYRDGVLMDEPDTAQTREHAQQRVDLHASERQQNPDWRGHAVLVHRYQHTTPWTPVEETPTGGCSHATCLPLNGDACQFDGAPATPDTAAILTRPWAWTPNNEIGGDAITADGRGPADGGLMVADLVRDEAIARYIADLHNRHLADVAERGHGPLSAPTSAERGTVAPEATPNPAETS